MGELQVFDHNGQLVTDSRYVAVMIEVRHSDLLERIHTYIQYLENGKFRSLDFFIPGSYEVDGNTKTYPCYLITKKGCEMLANKMTGEKGVLFTAAYVTKFNEMEKSLSATPYKLPQTYPEALRALADEAERREQLEAERQILLPKAALHDVFLTGENAQSMNIVAKSLNMGRNRLFKILRDKKILMDNNVPYQEHIDCGRFKVIEKPIKMNGETINKPQTLVTAKGVDFIGRLLQAKAS